MAEPVSDRIPSERRQSLIDATMSAISEHGFSNLTLAKIAGLAGLTAGTVNFHFDSKEALLLETLKTVAEEFDTHTERALAGAGPEPANRLQSLLDASLDPDLTQPRKVAVWYAFMSEASAREEYQRICGARDARYHDHLRTLCTTIINDAGRDGQMNGAAIGLALSGLVDELWQEILFASDGFDRATARDQIAAFLASVFPWCFDLPAVDAPEREHMTADADPEGLIQTLPAWVYSSEELFALELDEIFLPAWHIVCHLSDLPENGSYVAFDLANERALVVRDGDKVRAFHNVCRHRAHSLVSDATGQCPGRLTCPYHGWTYALDGTRIAIGAPDSFRPHDASRFGLKSLDCEVYQGFVFIRFRSGGPSVAEQFRPVADEFAGYQTTDMQWSFHGAEQTGFWTEEVTVDWKNAVENYLEDYHFATGHKGLAALMKPDYDRDPLPGMARLSHEMRDAPRGNWSAARYRTLLPNYTHLPKAARTRWTYYALFPANFFDLYPDKIDFMQMLPVAPGRMLLRGRSYGIPDPSRQGRAARYLTDRINSRVQDEDNLLTAEVQRGLASSAYDYGILSDKEVLVRHFQDWFRTRLPVATLRKPPRGFAARKPREVVARNPPREFDN